MPGGSEGGTVCLAVVKRNADEGAARVRSYVSDDRRKTSRVYDGPSPEAIRKTAEPSELPVDRITQVRVLEP
jgi:Nickel responsive protein SCO4226-like